MPALKDLRLARRAALVLLAALATGCIEGTDPGDPGSCRESTDCALGERCEAGSCAASACGPEVPCALGRACEDGACIDAAAGGVVVADLGGLRVTEDGSAELTVDLPEGSESFAVVVDGSNAALVLADTVEQPSGTRVFDWGAALETNRSNATDGVYTLLVPTTPAVELEPGRWRVSFLTDGSPFDASVTAVVKTAPATSATLDFNLFFVGVDGLDAATAQSHPEFARLLDNLEQRFADAGLALGTLSWHDVTGADAERFRIIDSVRDFDDELFELFRLSAGQSNRAINLFFVADIATSDGFSLLGLAGGIPGPPLVHGTLRSGVAVNMADWIAAGSEPAALAEARQVLELVVAHETGHYLGLYHTTERNGAALDPEGVTGADPLDDTPVCPDSADTSGNQILSADECSGRGSDNLMFWSPLPTSRALTAQQTAILRGNPLVR